MKLTSNLKSILAIAAIVALPVCAQAQQPKAAPKPTKASAQNVVKLISADKAKVKVYCDLAKLSDEAQEADQKKDTKKLEQISAKMDELGKQLGPEYDALMDGLQDVDPNSKLGQDIGASMEELDKLCAK